MFRWTEYHGHGMRWSLILGRLHLFALRWLPKHKIHREMKLMKTSNTEVKTHAYHRARVGNRTVTWSTQRRIARPLQLLSKLKDWLSRGNLELEGQLMQLERRKRQHKQRKAKASTYKQWWERVVIHSKVPNIFAYLLWHR